MLDLVTLVNTNDECIGTLHKLEAHRWPAQLHRASSVFLGRKSETGKIEILVQQRSQQKIVGAGQWANTCCGNVWPDESYAACARRRLEYELGIIAPDLQELTVFKYQVQCNELYGENEIDHIFAGWYKGKVDPNDEEVAAIKWVPLDDLALLPNISPWFALMLHNDEVFSKVKTFFET